MAVIVIVVKEKTKKFRVSLFYGAILLVVIGIISFLLFSLVITKARVSQAKHTAIQLEQAITTYFTEYSRYPVHSSVDWQNSDHMLASDDELMAPLVPDLPTSAPGMSPRQIQFFSARAAKETASGKFHNGIRTHPDGRKELLDPWGNHYRVILDTDRDDSVSPPAWSKFTTPIAQSVLIWSPGPDGKDETADDNVTSWE
jgi:type II secretory pathway pseudopilin PulG